MPAPKPTGQGRRPLCFVTFVDRLDMDCAGGRNQRAVALMHGGGYTTQTQYRACARTEPRPSATSHTGAMDQMVRLALVTDPLDRVGSIRRAATIAAPRCCTIAGPIDRLGFASRAGRQGHAGSRLSGRQHVQPSPQQPEGAAAGSSSTPHQPPTGKTPASTERSAMMTTSRRAMPNRTCAATLQPMDCMPVTSTPPLRCPTCGYDLHAADLAAPCPECGTPGADALKPSLVNHATRSMLLANLAGAAILAFLPAFMLVVVILSLMRISPLSGMNPRLYDMLQAMLLVVGVFLLTDTGRSTELATLRRRAMICRGAAVACGILSAMMLTGAREIVLNSGSWTGPSPLTWWGLFFECALPATIAVGLVGLWRYLWLWSELTRDRRARGLIAATFGLTLIVPVQIVVHSLARFALARVNGSLGVAVEWTSLPDRIRVWLFLAAVLLWLCLAIRFALTSLSVLRRKIAQ